MPRKPLAAIPLDERLKSGTDEEIRRRLRDFVRRVFKTQRAFEEAAGIPHETVGKWFSKRGTLPDFANLRKCFDQGLSLDWLLTGQGEMMQRLGSTDTGAVWERMIPQMRRSAHVGDFTTKQAYARMVIRFGGADGLTARAAELFQADFDAAVAEAQRGLDYLRLSADIHQKLIELAADETTSVEKRKLFDEMCVSLDKHLFRATTSEPERDPFESDEP